MSTRARLPTASTPPPSWGPVLRRRCACEGKGAGCDECRTSDTARRKTEGGTAPAEALPPIARQVLASPGERLDEGTRNFMESRLGHDFSRVRVHADARAAESARALGASAYALGPSVVLGPGSPRPGTQDHVRLLAHELAHVAQSGPLSSAEPVVGAAGDPAEGEANRAAERVASGQTARVSRSAGVARLRRKVLNKVVPDFQPRAKACMIHLHGEEKTALAVGKELRKRRCVSFMHLDTTERPIRFKAEAGTDKFSGQADPNRIFTPAGRRSQVAGLPKKRQAAAEAVLQEFADKELIPELAKCRNSGEEKADPLPVLALHNNQGLNPASFAASADKSVSPNPSRGEPQSPNDFLFVNQPADFAALKGHRNVVLQENPVQAANDDGSLSVLLAGQRYINVEKEGREHDQPKKSGGFKSFDGVYVKNHQMAAEVLDLFGVPAWPCGGTADFERRTRSMFNRRLGHSGRKTTLEKTDLPMAERDALPEKLPEGCQLFKDQPALDKHADFWKKQLDRLPMDNVIHWVLGGPDFTPAEPRAEVVAQRTCLIGALRKAPGLTVPKGDIVQSDRRSFKEQTGIFKRKMAFKGAPFDQVSPAAQAKCSLPASGVPWDPGDKDHKACWKTLSEDEKQKEVLMASSAPGLSRHHAGTDFDFGQSEKDLVPKEWTGSGRFADAFRWLARNASTYGFIQPFDTKGGHGKGYMPERWHWSYYPVAQAVLEFVMDHETEFEQALFAVLDKGGTGIKPSSFVAKNWRAYVYNVEQLGVF